MVCDTREMLNNSVKIKDKRRNELKVELLLRGKMHEKPSGARGSTKITLAGKQFRAERLFIQDSAPREKKETYGATAWRKARLKVRIRAPLPSLCDYLVPGNEVE